MAEETQAAVNEPEVGLFRSFLSALLMQIYEQSHATFNYLQSVSSIFEDIRTMMSPYPRKGEMFLWFKSDTHFYE